MSESTSDRPANPPDRADRPDRAEWPEWPGIAEAGGIDAWIVAELKTRNLWEEGVDTSKLSDKARKAYKARREEERRVRKLLRKHAWGAFRRANLVHLGVGVFYHDTVDVDRYDIADPQTRRQDNGLPEIADASALAKVLEISIAELRWLAFHRDVDSGTHYQRWLVPKRDGGKRLISAPKPKLKAVQRWIARNITEQLPVHGAAHGFLAGRSTVTNAEVHAGAKVLVKFDIKDFYPTITTNRVKGLMRKAGYNEQVATVLAMLVTEAPREPVEIRGETHHVATGPRSLPQGAPTSPSITNALCLRLDLRLAGLAHHLGIRYSRYADDMTFSFHGEAPHPIGKLKGGVKLIVESEGFTMHDKKTRVMRNGRRQKVTGLVINTAGPDQPVARVPRQMIRKVRAAIHNREVGKASGDLDRLHGLAAYIYMTDPTKGKALLDRVAQLKARGS